MTPSAGSREATEMDSFDSPVVNRVRSSGGVWELAGGQLLVPRVFGFCRGVRRALVMLDQAVRAHRGKGQRLFLLGQIIHNPWVNTYFGGQGVQILSAGEVEHLEKFIAPADCAIIPAFGVPLPVERRLRAIGCEIIDTSCVDVRRLWTWAEQAVAQGYAVLIFGRAQHDETVVTKSRLADIGGKYLVVGNLGQAELFADMILGQGPAAAFSEVFDAKATNADSLDPFIRLAQVSQTTMLYDETIELRDLLSRRFAQRFGGEAIEQHLLLQPTVCQATQARQAAGLELCRQGCDLVIVVGGFGSSNTRHLYEVARRYCPAYFVEDADAILSAHELQTIDLASSRPLTVKEYLPTRRPLRIGVLAGASTPEIVVGQVLEKLAMFLS